MGGIRIRRRVNCQVKVEVGNVIDGTAARAGIRPMDNDLFLIILDILGT